MRNALSVSTFFALNVGVAGSSNWKSSALKGLK